MARRPATYLAATFLTFWPGSMLLGAAASLAWRERGETIVRLLIAWIVPFWLVLELIPTKLPNYALPIYPALALLAARALMAPGGDPPRRSWLDIAAMVLWSIATLILAGALVEVPRRLTGFLPPVDIGVAVLVVAVAATFLVSRVLRQPRILPGLLAAVLLSEGVFGLILPTLDPIWLSRSVARVIAQDHLEGRPVVAAGYAEPSLVFLLGTDTRLTTGESAARFLMESPTALAVVSDREEAPFQAALAARHASRDGGGHGERPQLFQWPSNDPHPL